MVFGTSPVFGDGINLKSSIENPHAERTPRVPVNLKSQIVNLKSFDRSFA
jgi:hypothetical protein